MESKINEYLEKAHKASKEKKEANIVVFKEEVKKQAVADMWFSSRHNRDLLEKNCNLTDPTVNRYIACLVSSGFIIQSVHGRGFYNLTEETK